MIIRAITVLLASAAFTACAPRGETTMPSGTQALTIEASPNGHGHTLSISEARDRIRQWKSEGRDLSAGVVVLLEAGTYRFAEPLRLTADDSGADGAPVVYRAKKGADVRFTGGKAVTGWEQWKDGILSADVSELGLAALEYGSTDAVQRTEVFYRGRRMDLARWPNHDPSAPHGGKWAYVDGTPEEETKTEFIVRADSDRIARWAESPNAQVHIFARYDWRDNYSGIDRVDAEARTVHLSDPTSYFIAPGRRYYVRNVLSELDVPGEWYLDADAHTLYFMPPEAVHGEDVEVSFAARILEFDGASHIAIQGVTLEATREEAIRIDGGTGVTIGGCTIRNTGGYAVDINSGAGHRIVGCDIYETGGGGVQLGGGDRKTLEPGGNSVENCHIHHFQRLNKTYNPAVLLLGVGNRVANNLIHDAPHTAILLHGNDHVIEYNEIHDVVQESQDAGAFYMGRNWTERGNVIRYNVFHDIYGYGLSGGDADLGFWEYESPRTAWAIYLDDNASGTTVYGNAFYRCALGAVMIGGGKDNTVKNNIMAECYPAVHIDARWANFFESDSLGGVNDYMRGHLAEVNYLQPPYSERYPNLTGVLDEQRVPARNKIVGNVATYRRDDIDGFDDLKERAESATVWHLTNFDPSSTQIDSNVIWHNGAPIRVSSQYYLDLPVKLMGWDEWRRSGFDTHSVVAEPGFAEPATDDYRLMQESPATALGFKALPWDRIGPYQDAMRASWPVDRTPRIPRRDSVERTVEVIRIFDFETGTKWHFAKRFSIAGPFALLWNGIWAGYGQYQQPQRPSGFDFAYGPENPSMRNPLATFETMDGDCRWTTVERDTLGYLDFLRHFRTTNNAIAYAFMTVTAPQAMTTQLSLGSNDGARVWVNDKLVVDVNAGRAAKPHQNVVTVNLRAGKNTVLVKVANVGGNWGMYLAFEDPDRVLTYGVE